MTYQSHNPKVLALLEKLKRNQATTTAQESPKEIPVENVSVNVSEHVGMTTYDRYGNLITYNSKQQEFIDLAIEGKSCVLIGSAGTGKTTCMRGLIETLIQKSHIPQLSSPHKHLQVGRPGIVIISYTRRAVSNIKKVLSQDLKDNAITYHKLMEYEPVFYEVIDEVTGEGKNTMKFEPCRNQFNPLDSNIHTIIVEESSMLSVEYHTILLKALHDGVQIIYLGDIYQLPPVFGSAILGFKLNELPVVELTEVYRQALNSPIIAYAHKIKNGRGFMVEKKMEVVTDEGKVTFHPWKKKLLAEDAVSVIAKFFAQSYDLGEYTPGEDMILIPFNKAYGTIEVNNHIASHIASKSHSVVWEIIAGFNKIYLREGEIVMYDKEDAIVTRIAHAPQYIGKRPQPQSVYMNYWGQLNEDESAHKSSILELEAEDFELDVDAILESVVSGSKDEDRVHKASHTVTVKLLDSGREILLSTASELNSLLLGYALTVHKAQGSEWNRVYLLFHHSHATMLSRELLYTAFTRAKEEVYCICEKDTFIKGVKSQRIKGTTLAEKAEYFKGILPKKT